MKKNRSDRNIRVLAENNGNRGGFNIYLVFSGQKEYLMYHRHNGLLYGLLKDGIVIDDVRRWKPSRTGVSRAGKSKASQLYDMVSHLMSVIDDYLTEREACQTGGIAC